MDVASFYQRLRCLSASRFHAVREEKVQSFPPYFPPEPGGVSAAVVAVPNSAPTVLDFELVSVSQS